MRLELRDAAQGSCPHCCGRERLAPLTGQYSLNGRYQLCSIVGWKGKYQDAQIRGQSHIVAGDRIGGQKNRDVLRSRVALDVTAKTQVIVARSRVEAGDEDLRNARLKGLESRCRIVNGDHVEPD